MIFTCGVLSDETILNRAAVRLFIDGTEGWFWWSVWGGSHYE